MSAVKFNYPPYKLFEPQYHPQRPIIIDAEAIESPETVTLRYEEEAAARANGGDPRGESPPSLLNIEACPKQDPPPPMNSFESPRSYQDPPYQYAGQSFSSQQTENVAAAQLNHLAFSANSSTGQYMSSVVPTVTSYQPTSGIFGTKVAIKISVAYDLVAVTSHVFLAFGAHKCPAHASRDSSDASGFGYVVSGEAPQLEDTRIPSSNVPISLLIESADGQTLANIDVGTFTYDTQAVSAEGPHEAITRRLSSRSAEEEQHQHQQRGTPLKHEQPEADHLHEAATNATNTYPYASTAHQTVASTYDAPGYPSANSNSMLSTYHRPSYGAHYPRPPPLLKTPSWTSPYGHSLASPRSPSTLPHSTTISRPTTTTVTALPMPTTSPPLLMRTSTIQATNPAGGTSLNPYALYSDKAVLKINGDLDSMASNWTSEECENGRRLVMFSRKQQGATLSTTFKAVSASERPPNSICVSCIYWAEKRECFVTSVDTIGLLEQLVSTRFGVDEKNRIRRNLEGFHPLTVSKTKPDSEEFFKIIMGFPNPKPRNIEKDVKVFPWKKLAPALKKIISKYSASPNSSGPSHTVPSYPPASGPSTLLTPVSTTSPGLYGPPHTPTITDNSYAHHDSQSMVSPRSLSGPPPNWGPYTTRTLSPSIKSHSPQSGSMRMPSLPSYANHSLHSYGLPSHSHRWDTNGYGDASATSAYTGHSHPSHVYGTGAYGSDHHRD
ncbi:hypothetical protein F4777DRAFT_458989 [Nemania sp. FL0916]|nr:hypothetical protein F4777DRAFT_458989 [Nemania sp. FL0916]